jgi:hypothetical protein
LSYSSTTAEDTLEKIINTWESIAKRKDMWADAKQRFAA